MKLKNEYDFSICIFSKADIQKINNHTKRCSASSFIRGIQIKTTIKYHFMHSWKAMNKKT